MAYYIPSKSANSGGPTVRDLVPFLPATSPCGRFVCDHFNEAEDTGPVHEILRAVVDEGLSYPQWSVDSDLEFRAFYLSHDVFVARDTASGAVVGSFYVKPNFPGRSSHICNTGLIVHPSHRGRGVGTFLGGLFLRVSPALGYRAAFFNLVYECNTASLSLWRRLGFAEVGRVPEAGNLKGVGFTDAIQFYKKF